MRLTSPMVPIQGIVVKLRHEGVHGRHGDGRAGCHRVGELPLPLRNFKLSPGVPRSHELTGKRIPHIVHAMVRATSEALGVETARMLPADAPANDRESGSSSTPKGSGARPVPWWLQNGSQPGSLLTKRVANAADSRGTAMAKLQNLARSRLLAKLHAQNLADRLLFEARLLHGLFRLFNQLVVFWLMVCALGLSGEPHVKRGIYRNLAEAFDFDGLRNLRSRDTFLETLPQISQVSKKYFLLSNQYWDAGMGGAVELVGAFQALDAPRLLAGTELSIHARAISFTSWVQVIFSRSGSCHRERGVSVEVTDGKDHFQSRSVLLNCMGLCGCYVLGMVLSCVFIMRRAHFT